MIEIRSDAGKFSKEFERKIVRQVPFVASVAVNNILQKTRDQEVWRSYSAAFTVRNVPFFKQVAAIFRSNRSQARMYGAVMGSIQEKMAPPPPGVRAQSGKDSHTDMMRLHTTGGVKGPTRSKKLAIPMGSPRRKAGGAVYAADKPRRITGSNRGFRAGKYIMRRKNKTEVEVLYHLEPSAKIKRAWNPFAAVQRGVNARMRHEFASAWIRALRTMR